jgi:transcriptional regulator with XRE-family HTH domain
MNLPDIGHQVRARREALGLTQDRLAKLAGLSRATINQLENGSLPDLGFAKVASLLDVLGLRLGADLKPVKRRGLLMASRTASVSFKRRLDADALAHILASGTVPRQLAPHVSALIDEAPLPVVVAAVEDAAQRMHVPPRLIWQHVAAWAAATKSPRPAWS